MLGLERDAWSRLKVSNNGVRPPRALDRSERYFVHDIAIPVE